MSRQRVVNVAALRELIARERARLGPLAGGGSVALTLEDLESIADELELAREATGRLAELAGDAVAAAVYAADAKTLDAERARIRRQTLPGLLERLPRRPGSFDPKAAHVERMTELGEAIAEAIEISGQEGRDPDAHA